MSEPQSCCRWCTSFIFTLGLTALFLWLSLRPSSPKYSIDYFYAPGLNTTLVQTNRNTTVDIIFKIENTNKDKGIYYDNLIIGLSHLKNDSFSPVGNDSVPGFYQGHKKRAMKPLNVQTAGIDWNSDVKNVSGTGTVTFRVDLATAVRYKIVGWKTKRHRFQLRGDVQVDKTGLKNNGKKGIRLKSGSPELGRSGADVGMIVFCVLFLGLLG